MNIIGLILFFAGVASADSDNVFIPLILAGVGLVMLMKGAKDGN